MPPRWGMVIDLDNCLGCQGCVLACKTEYDLPPRTHDRPENQTPLWSKVYTIGPMGKFPKLRLYYLPVLCNHCEKPRCLESCPAGAIEKQIDGVVLIDQSKCTGCGQCFWACPYGVIYYEQKEGKASKCDFCFQRIKKRTDPLCVSVCLGKCRVFGDLNDPSSEICKTLTQNQKRLYKIPVPPHIDTNPSVYYLLS
jgi:Fe-S-cluster-containing dehydrogenase component